jgi:hypothetical protein
MVNLPKIKRELEKIICKVHGKGSVKLRISQNKIEVKNPCCPDFEKELHLKFDAEVLKQIDGIVGGKSDKI